MDCRGITTEQSWFDYTRTGFPLVYQYHVLLQQTTDQFVYFIPGDLSANGAVPAQQMRLLLKYFGLTN
jgi:hypothetical protein